MADSRPIVVQPLDPELLAQLSRLLHKVKHDLSNSLVASMGELELLASDVVDAELAERLQDTRRKLLRPFQELRRMTASLPLPGRAQLRWTDERQQLDARARDVGVTLVWQPEAHALITDEPALRPVTAALVTNALDAGTAGVTITVELLPGTPAALRVRDDGPGCADLVAAANGELIRAGAAHLGLGLRVAASILATQGGELTLSTQTPRGFVAVATWPTP